VSHVPPCLVALITIFRMIISAIMLIMVNGTATASQPLRSTVCRAGNVVSQFGHVGAS
jgi:hypothetical protein